MLGVGFMSLPEEGLEPSLCCQNGILNPARLPIPPLRLTLLTYITGIWRFSGKKYSIPFDQAPFWDASAPIRAPKHQRDHCPEKRAERQGLSARQPAAMERRGSFLNAVAEEPE